MTLYDVSVCDFSNHEEHEGTRREGICDIGAEVMQRSRFWAALTLARAFHMMGAIRLVRSKGGVGLGVRRDSERGLL